MLRSTTAVQRRQVTVLTGRLTNVGVPTAEIAAAKAPGVRRVESVADLAGALAAIRPDQWQALAAATEGTRDLVLAAWASRLASAVLLGEDVEPPCAAQRGAPARHRTDLPARLRLRGRRRTVHRPTPCPGPRDAGRPAPSRPRGLRPDDVDPRRLGAPLRGHDAGRGCSDSPATSSALPSTLSSTSPAPRPTPRPSTTPPGGAAACRRSPPTGVCRSSPSPGPRREPRAGRRALRPRSGTLRPRGRRLRAAGLDVGAAVARRAARAAGPPARRVGPRTDRKQHERRLLRRRAGPAARRGPRHRGRQRRGRAQGDAGRTPRRPPSRWPCRRGTATGPCASSEPTRRASPWCSSACTTATSAGSRSTRRVGSSVTC